MTFSFLQATDIFWKQHPALFHGIAFFLGVFTAQEKHLLSFLPLTLFFSPFFFFKYLKKRSMCQLFISIIIFFSGYMYIHHTTLFPSMPHNKEINGIATFSPSKMQTTFFHGKYWDYTGTAHFFKNKKLIAKNLPCKMRIADKLNRPPGNCSYQFQATLIEIGKKRFALKPEKDSPIKILPKTWGPAEMRYKAQNAVSSYIKKEIRNPQTANFLVGIITGDFQDRLLSYEFNRFGLQHIMAISGFHFAIFASILGAVFSLVLSKRKATLLLIACLSIYFVFLGSSPSIMRAWLTCTIALIGSLIGCKASGLNSLGIALFFVLLFEPVAASSIGFQFSFATTASILLLYPACDHFLQCIFPKRNLQQGIKMKPITQHGYIFLSFFRQAIALDFSVNLIAIPLTLYYFQKVPLLSAVYNLFFPFLISFSLFFLILSLGISPLLPPIASLINKLNNFYTTFILEYTHNIPSSVDISFSTADFPAEIIVIQCISILILGILYRSSQALEKQKTHEWSFI